MGKTRKNNKSKVMTIPQLRKAFEAVEHMTQRILQRPIDKSSIENFQKGWKSIFGKQIDSNVAESYLTIQTKLKTKVRGKKTRKQKGGVASLDYQYRPGIDGPYGQYLPYITSGFKFYDAINQTAMDSSCGKENITPLVSADMGSNKVGGASFNELTSGRLGTASVPPNLLQDVQDIMQGRTLGTSPQAFNTSYRSA
jgi:hypothetical protein